LRASISCWSPRCNSLGLVIICSCNYSTTCSQ
jgi:hypothetical protein